MGLDGFVNCNCYRDGKTTPFPLPTYEAHFITDDEGYLALNLPYDGNETLFEAVYHWKHTACEHRDMAQACEGVANWTGYRIFHQALEGLGFHRFPVLRRYLPTENGGMMPADACQQALDELAFFKSRVGIGRNTYLYDTLTNEVLSDYIELHNGIFAFACSVPGMSAGVDHGGFFISESEANTRTPSRKFFRARRFEQYVSQLDERGLPVQVEYQDLDSNATFKGSFLAIKRVKSDAQGNLKVQYPRLLHVETRKGRAERFAYILDPLTRLFQAATETGNPVVWC